MHVEAAAQRFIEFNTSSLLGGFWFDSRCCLKNDSAISLRARCVLSSCMCERNTQSSDRVGAERTSLLDFFLVSELIKGGVPLFTLW